MTARRERRAFATALAVIMIALVGAVALMMMTRLRDQARRTVREETGAQVRQLMLAGGTVATDLPRVWRATGVQGQTISVPVPRELAGRGASVAIVVKQVAAERAEAEVRVACDGKAERETVRFVRAEAGWRVDGVERE